MKEIQYLGMKFFIPERFYHSNLLKRFENKSYEKEELSFINSFYDQQDVVLEVGSCLGVTTAHLAKKVKFVISFEANPELKESLEKFKAENNLYNLKIYNKYISNTKKEINFQTYDNIVAGSGDRQDLNINNARGWGHTLKEYKVECISLNDIENIELVNCLFLDAEGGELSFIQENKDFIRKQIKKISLELHGHLMKNKDFNQQCQNLIKSMNFSLKQKIGNCFHYEKTE